MVSWDLLKGQRKLIIPSSSLLETIGSTWFSCIGPREHSVDGRVSCTSSVCVCVCVCVCVHMYLCMCVMCVRV